MYSENTPSKFLTSTAGIPPVNITSGFFSADPELNHGMVLICFSLLFCRDLNLIKKLKPKHNTRLCFAAALTSLLC